MHNKKTQLVLLILAIVVAKFLYSLTNEFWFKDEDVVQIYLIGLRSYTTQTFPYFGADLIYTGAQIPGALLGFLVSAGWYLWEIPEAPFIVLAILMVLSQGFLAWYAARRLPQINTLFIWVYVLCVPWAVCYFTRIINPSYVIPGAIVFFIGIFEIVPQLRKNVLPLWLSYYFLGFGLFWIFQLHMSWVLLVPFIMLAFYYLLRSKNIRQILLSSSAFIFGCLTTGSLVLPTFIEYGLSDPKGKNVSSMVGLSLENLAHIPKLLVSFLAYASFDVPRFVGGSTSERLAFLSDHLWAAPFTVFVAIVGVVHALYLALSFFRLRTKDSDLRPVIYITLFGFFAFCGASLFSKAPPLTHQSVLFFPLVILYSLYVLRSFLQTKWGARVFILTFVSAGMMYAALAMKNYSTVSLYTNREVVVRALEANDYTIMGKRRYEK